MPDLAGRVRRSHYGDGAGREEGGQVRGVGGPVARGPRRYAAGRVRVRTRRRVVRIGEDDLGVEHHVPVLPHEHRVEVDRIEPVAEGETEAGRVE